MAEKALQKAGYLTGTEKKGELDSDFLRDVASDFVADILHLIQLHGGKIDEEGIVDKIIYGAKAAYASDIGYKI
jgi:hypothetical protein